MGKWLCSIKCLRDLHLLLLLLNETSVEFMEVKSRVESVNFTDPSPDDFALAYAQGWASFKCCHMLVMFPTYEKSHEQSLQLTLFLFFLSGFKNLPWQGIQSTAKQY